MKKNAIFLLLMLPVMVLGNGYEDDLTDMDFDMLLEESKNIVDSKELAEKEEDITRAAKAIKERMDMGMIYNGDGTFDVVETRREKVSDNIKSDVVNTKTFRFPTNVAQEKKEIPKLIGVINNFAKLEFNGQIKEYKNGDRVGEYYVDRVSVGSVYLRDNESKRLELKNTW